MKMLNLKR